MPLTLVRRAGADTLGKLEAAARRRFREAHALEESGEHLGAIYLYGYSVEIRLKAAYYRTIGLVPRTTIDRATHRIPAEQMIRNLPSLPPGSAPGHHVIGWAALLEQARAQVGRPMPAPLVAEMSRQAHNVFKCWTESLRYRANTPYNQELEAVRQAANWFRTHATRLWR